MAANERIKKYLEAGTVFGQVTRARAEEIVKELVSGGDIQRGQAQEWVDNLVDRSRKTSEQVLELVRHEVSAQLSRIDSSAVENLANQVADILKRSAEAGRSATAGATTQATNRAQSVRKSATKSAKSATKTAKATATNTAKAARKAAESVSPSGRKKDAGQEGDVCVRPQEDGGQEDGGQRQEDRGQEDPGQEGRDEEDRGQEDRHGRIRHLSNAARRRLDTELVRRGLVATRTEALEAITSGLVVVSGTQADKAARLVAPNEPVVVLGPPGPLRQPRRREARRGPDPVRHRRDGSARARCRRIDRRLHPLPPPAGAVTVYAVDVGHGQLDQRLRTDPRVTVLERVNVRSLTPEVLSQVDPDFVPCSIVTADLSFISLVTVVPALTGPVGTDRADLVLLVKPQFEAGRAVVARGKGVVRDPEVWLQALGDVTSALQSAGTGIMGAMVSPLTGPAGNVEFLVHVRKGAAPAEEDVVDRLLEAAVSEAVARRSATSTAD